MVILSQRAYRRKANKKHDSWVKQATPVMLHDVFQSEPPVRTPSDSWVIWYGLVHKLHWSSNDNCHLVGGFFGVSERVSRMHVFLLVEWLLESMVRDPCATVCSILLTTATTFTSTPWSYSRESESNFPAGFASANCTLATNVNDQKLFVLPSVDRKFVSSRWIARWMTESNNRFLPSCYLNDGETAEKCVRWKIFFLKKKDWMVALCLRFFKARKAFVV